MQFEFIEKISHPLDEVYAALKDGLTDVVPFVPNVVRLNELKREELGHGETKIVNEWQGDPGAAPKLIRPFMKPEMHIWRDYAHWKDKEFLVDWRFEAPLLSKFYDCSGTNYVEADSKNASIVRLTGNLQTYPERIRGVPSLLAKKAAPTVEKWLINLVSPNLSELPKAVQVYLDQKS